LNDFQSRGVTVIGISYDSTQILKSFSDKFNISYPLLSDAGSFVIKEFGILNTKIDSGKKSFGIPYPGIYIIDKNLKVIDKQFEQSYSARPTAANVLTTRFNKQLNSNVQHFQTDYLNGSFGLSDSSGYAAQILAIIFEISLKNGFHLYSQPIPEGYIPLTIKLESDPDIVMDAFHFPKTKKLRLNSINETFNILPAHLSLKTFLRISKNPKPGTHILKFTIKFQACDDKECRMPEEFEFVFPLLIKK